LPDLRRPAAGPGRRLPSIFSLTAQASGSAGPSSPQNRHSARPAFTSRRSSARRVSTLGPNRSPACRGFFLGRLSWRPLSLP
jgi:hypothetical protein